MNLTNEQQKILGEIIAEKLKEHETQMLTELRSKIAALEGKLNCAYTDLPAETLAGIVVLNQNLTDLQKSQICAILTAPSQKGDYIK